MTGDVRGGEDAHDARHAGRVRRIQRQQAGMVVRAAQDLDREQAFHGQVFDVAGLPGDFAGRIAPDGAAADGMVPRVRSWKNGHGVKAIIKLTAKTRRREEEG